MESYVCILRGINVSGQKLMKMSDLKMLFEEMGFQNVQTYIQSGNIVFNAPNQDPLKLASMVATQIKKSFGFDVPVLVKTFKTLKFTLDNNPFVERGEDTNQLYVTFLETKPPKGKLNSIDQKAYAPEEFHCVRDIIYFLAPNGYGKAKMNNNFFENKLKITATTRNWKTVNKLFIMAKENK